MSASSPMTTCERLSFVDICTVISVSAHRGLGGGGVGDRGDEVAAEREPDLDLAARIASDGLHGVEPCRARRLERELRLEGVEEAAGGIFSQIPIVRSPCTLLCPRIGDAPAPGLPMFPRSSSRLMISLMVSTALRCCVRPIAQVMITRSASR